MDIKDSQALYEVAIRCFRDTADQDYIHARLAYRNGLMPQFLWSSLHCLEKYSKCILLANLIKGKEISHNISPAINKFEKHTNVSLNISDDINAFINKLEERAKYRYSTVSNMSFGYDIFLLDKSVHQIRRYCQQFSFDKKQRESEISNLATQLNFESKIKDVCQITFEAGILEKILRDKKHPARKALIYHNAFFKSRNRSKVSVNHSFKGYNSPFFQRPELVELAKEYIRIEHEVIRAYREEYN